MIKVHRAWLAPLALALACGTPPRAASTTPPAPPPQIEMSLSVISANEPEAAPTQSPLSDVAERRPVLIFYLASWCAMCISELPALDHLSRDVHVVLITLDAQPGPALLRFMARQRGGMTLALADEATRAGSTPFGPLTTLPLAVLLDRQRREIERFWGTAPIFYILRRVKASGTQ
ncbi:hypothetical protein KKF91_18620 [Myxococcota bacterium]|nr:hypothetical protein [Myxococcota bacterium]